MSILQWRLGKFPQKYISLYLYLGLFFENRKNSGLILGQIDDSLTRWPGRERWPKWLIDPVTQWPSSTSGVRRETRSQNVAFSVTAQNIGTLHGRRRCDGQRRTITTNDMQQRHGLPVYQCVYWDCTVHPRSDSDGPGSSIVMLWIAGCVCDMYRTEDRITLHKLVVKHLHTKI